MGAIRTIFLLLAVACLVSSIAIERRGKGKGKGKGKSAKSPSSIKSIKEASIKSIKSPSSLKKSTSRSGSSSTSSVVLEPLYCDVNPDNCTNGGTCVNNLEIRGDGYCLCVPGTTGPYCETDIDECASSPCEAGQTCIESNNFAGPLMLDAFLCDGPGKTPCEVASVCINGGTCTDDIANFSWACACAPGYAGSSCEFDINECASSPCQNGAWCSNEVNQYSCACAAGYNGTNCENDINECLLDRGHGPTWCRAAACAAPFCVDPVCTDLVNNATCDCPPDYVYSATDGCVALFQCPYPRVPSHGDTWCRAANCVGCINSTCTEGVDNNNATCSCPPNYDYSADKGCFPVDPCTIVPNVCPNNSTCGNSVYSDVTGWFYNCTCPPNFRGEFCNETCNLNLVSNDGFEEIGVDGIATAELIGFDTSYVSVASDNTAGRESSNPMRSEGRCVVLNNETDASSYHSSWSACAGRANSSRALLCNGATAVNINARTPYVSASPIPVFGGSDYTASAWFASVFTTFAMDLRLEVCETPAGVDVTDFCRVDTDNANWVTITSSATELLTRNTDDTTFPQVCDYVENAGTFTTQPSSTHILLRVLNDSRAPSGNDFLIDDVTLSRACVDAPATTVTPG